MTMAAADALVRPRGGPARGPARLVRLLAGPGSGLTIEEAAELVAAWLEPAADLGERPTKASACRCRKPWLFEPRHCTACGRDLGGTAG